MEKTQSHRPWISWLSIFSLPEVTGFIREIFLNLDVVEFRFEGDTAVKGLLIRG